MAELATMKPADDHFDSKVTVLCELVNHHVREEEKEMFKKIDEADIDEEELAAEVAARKVELKEEEPNLKAPTKSANSRSHAKAKK